MSDTGDVNKRDRIQPLKAYISMEKTVNKQVNRTKIKVIVYPI